MTLFMPRLMTNRSHFIESDYTIKCQIIWSCMYIIPWTQQTENQLLKSTTGTRQFSSLCPFRHGDMSNGRTRTQDMSTRRLVTSPTGMILTGNHSTDRLQYKRGDRL